MLNWFAKFWDNVDANTIFTVFITILTFALGFIINGIIKSYTNGRKKNSYKKSLFFYFKVLSILVKSKSFLLPNLYKRQDLHNRMIL